jgi:hypothetical protein
VYGNTPGAISSKDQKCSEKNRYKGYIKEFDVLCQMDAARNISTIFFSSGFTFPINPYAVRPDEYGEDYS